MSKYNELKQRVNELKKDKYAIEEKINDLNKELREMPEHTLIYLGLSDKVTSENTPYLYSLLLKISGVVNDDRDELEWGRGKNIVNYDGIMFTYEGTEYTTGRASNWCTGEYLYTPYDKSNRR